MTPTDQALGWLGLDDRLHAYFLAFQLVTLCPKESKGSLIAISPAAFVSGCQSEEALRSTLRIARRSLGMERRCHARVVGLPPNILTYSMWPVCLGGTPASQRVLRTPQTCRSPISDRKAADAGYFPAGPRTPLRRLTAVPFIAALGNVPWRWRRC